MSNAGGDTQCFGFKFDEPDLHMVETVRAIVSQCIWEAQGKDEVWHDLDVADRDAVMANVTVEGGDHDAEFQDCYDFMADVHHSSENADGTLVKNLQAKKHKKNVALRKDGKMTFFNHEGTDLSKKHESAVITFDGSHMDPFHAMLHDDQAKILVLSNHNEGKCVADIDLETQSIVNT